MPALDDSVITKAEVEREDTAAVGAGLDVLEEPDNIRESWVAPARQFDHPADPGAGCRPGHLGDRLPAGAQARGDAAVTGGGVGRAAPGCSRAARPGNHLDQPVPRSVRVRRWRSSSVCRSVWLIARFSWLRASFGPLLTGLQSMPSVAWVPLAILWFQISPAMIYMVVLLGAVPSIANGLIAGIDQVPPLFHRVGHVLGLGWWGQTRHVLLPAALPGFLAGLRQGWAFSWRSLMAAELIVTSSKLGFGLGQLMNQGRDLSDAPLLYAGLILIFVVGVGVELILFRPLERAILDARGLSTKKR